MSNDHLVHPEQRSAKPGGGPSPATGEAGDKPPASDVPELGRDNRGRRANVTKAGEVIGSGSSAGGGGGPEDIDSDSAAGGGGDSQPSAHKT